MTKSALTTTGPAFTGPDRDCPFCPRLVEFRETNRQKFPHFHNAPVPAFGSLEAPILLVGLGPGLKGANATGRPFTGDWAGDLLYSTLQKFGCATGEYAERADDGLTLAGVRITNAVRCVPPANRPTTPEAKACRPFLAQEIAAMPNLRAILAIGGFAHDAILAAMGLKKSGFIFAHGARHSLPLSGRAKPVSLIDSYHCSRLNTNTGRLTEDMFHKVFADLVAAAQN